MNTDGAADVKLSDRHARTDKIHKRTKQEYKSDVDTISNRANNAARASRRRDSARDSERSARKKDFMEKRRVEIARLA